MPPKRKAATTPKVEEKEKEKESEGEEEALGSVVVSFFGFTAQEEKTLGKLITDNGGRVLKTVAKSVTHLVATKEAVKEGGAKVNNAVNAKIFIVNKSFIEDSCSAGKKVDESDTKYDLKPFIAEEEEEEEEEKEKEEEAVPKRKTRSSTASKPEPPEKKTRSDSPPPATTTTTTTTTTTASTSPKVEKKVKVLKKGRAVVDIYSGLSVQAHVYESGDDIYDCMLNQTNIGNNNNKFYVIQLLEMDSGGDYCVWNRWGRVGEKGQSKKIPFGGNLNGAIVEFKKKFAEKTQNSWENRKKFVAYDGKYTLIEIDYSHDEEKKEETVEKKPVQASDSKLDKRIQDLIALIFDIKMMEQTLVEMEFDLEKMPLGKLTKKQIMDGYQVLKDIEKAMKNGPKASLESLSSKFYTLIPHSFGRNRPPVINTDEMLRKKLGMLEALADIEIATKFLKETADGKENPIDSNYKKLENKLTPIDKSTDEFKLIEKYIYNSQNKGAVRLELVDLFATERKGDERYEKFKPLGNRKLLWHGSRLSNFVGILSQGLRIAPPEAPVSGYRFGKGMYFADIMTLSSHYCRVQASSPIGCMLLFDVALGKTYECARDEYMDKPKGGYDSTWALGTVEPDPSGDIAVKEGYVVPAGPLHPSPWASKNVSCLEHQYITYNEAQAQMKYLMIVKWNFGKKV